MIRITLSIFLFGACSAIYRDVDLCILENDKNWFMPDDNFDPHSLLINRKFIMEAEDDEEYISYSLYTRMNPTTPQILLYEDDNSLTNSNFDARNVTVFLIHGWLGNGNSTMNTLLIEAFLQSATLNVIVVDWGYFANLNYVSSLLSISKVGVDVGKFIRWLVGRGLSYENMHVVGFSLGSHIAGTAGKKTDSRIRRITALDPAVLWFFLPHRIDKTDAQYVEVIHTNTKLFGYKGPCGHADFYPNGGAFMPNCWLNMCSHSMSYQYMAETVKHNDVMGHSCDHLSNIDEDNCSDAKYPMGNNELSKNISGLFRLNILFEKQIISYLRNGPPDVYDKELCY